jgi:hypothetical protein
MVRLKLVTNGEDKAIVVADLGEQDVDDNEKRTTRLVLAEFETDDPKVLIARLCTLEGA